MKKIFATPIAVLLTLIIAVSVVGAQSANNETQGLQVSPPRVELNAVKGNVYNVDISVTNVTSEDLTYTTQLRDFTASDREDGSPLLEVDESMSTTASIRSWISDIPAFGLKSRETKKITFKVSVPNNAEPGGHYGAVLFSGSAPELHSTGVGLSASTGVLLLVRVDGDIAESADVMSFYTAAGDNQTFIFEGSPINFVARVKNTGNVHIKPVGKIEVKDMFGNLVSTLDINKDSSNVLPDSIRRFTETYDGGNKMLFGHYTADLAIGYGTKGQAIVRTIDFWVIPYKLIAVVLFIVVTIVFMFRRYMKSYSQRIINKHEASKKNKD